MMRVWVIWPEAAKTSLAHVITAGGGTIAYTDDVLDRAEADWSTRAADVVVVNSLTPGSQDFAKWIIARHFERPTLRIIVAFPSLTRNPQGMNWAQQLLSASVVDWVMDGPQFAQDLQARLTTPWTWADAVRMLGGPEALQSLAPRGPESPRTVRESAPPAEERLPQRREVVVVSPAKPVVIAVVGVASGVGTSCTAVGLANYLVDHGQPTVLVEPAGVQTSTFGDWQPAVRATIAPDTLAWHQLPAQRTWSYIVLDCHVNLRDIPAHADLVVVVGPGAPHRQHRWTHWDRAQQVREAYWTDQVARYVGVLAPHPSAGSVMKMLRQRARFQDVPLVIGDDVFGETEVFASWATILAPVLPAVAPATSPSRRWGWPGRKEKMK